MLDLGCFISGSVPTSCWRSTNPNRIRSSRRRRTAEEIRTFSSASALGPVRPAREERALCAWPAPGAVERQHPSSQPANLPDDRGTSASSRTHTVRRRSWAAGIPNAAVTQRVVTLETRTLLGTSSGQHGWMMNN